MIEFNSEWNIVDDVPMFKIIMGKDGVYYEHEIDASVSFNNGNSALQALQKMMGELVSKHYSENESFIEELKEELSLLDVQRNSLMSKILSLESKL